MQQAIGTASRDRTVIMVAHRRSKFADADRIIVLDNGRIVETGTYADLMDKDGVFAELVRASEMSPTECPRSPVVAQPPLGLWDHWDRWDPFRGFNGPLGPTLARTVGTGAVKVRPRRAAISSENRMQLAFFVAYPVLLLTIW